MKLSKVEWFILALAGLLLAFTVGYFTGTRNAGSVSLAGVTVQTEALAEATVSEQTEQASSDAQPSDSGAAQTEESAQAEAAAEPSAEDAAQETAEPAESAESAESDSGLVNINTATAEELTALPGIGEALAERIVAYREENGPFASVEELTNVSGIGDGKLANLLDSITVGE